MTQTLTTDLPALTTTPNPAISLIGNHQVCATCGGDLVADEDVPAVTFCGACLSVDLAPIQATLAVLEWVKASARHVEAISISEWTDEENQDRPPIAIPGRYWSVDVDVLNAAGETENPRLFVIQQQDGSMQVVPDDFAACHQALGGACDRYILTDADGTRRCPEHGAVTAWNIPVSFYEDEPEVLAQDAADFARLGTVQWLDDYPEDEDDK